VSLHSFNFFLLGPIKFNKKKVGLVRDKGQAKNGDKLFWEKIFHAANGKAQAHTECPLHFFLLSLGGEGFKGGYFSVLPDSHYVDHAIIRSLWLGPQRKGGFRPIMNYRIKTPTPISL